MAYESVKTSAPGKLMMLGEHAVLYGRECLVCAVNRRVEVILEPRSDRIISINSGLGDYSGSLDCLAEDQRFSFLLCAVNHFNPSLDHGFNLRVASEFSNLIGLGSSSAVTVAAVGAIRRHLKKSIEPEKIFQDSLSIIRAVQGTGSGADVAASVFGGIVKYRQCPLEIEKLQASCPLTVVFSGHKTPTVSVIKQVKASYAEFPEVYNEIFDVMAASSDAAVSAIASCDWVRFGKLLNINQGLMDAIGVSDESTKTLVHRLRNEAGIFGAKNSGSGLGDCVLGLGLADCDDLPNVIRSIEVEEQGVLIE
jgi:mevalonate kinase